MQDETLTSYPGVTVIPVTSLNIPELQPYRTLRRPADHLREGIFVAEGEKVVRRLLQTNLEVVSLLMTPLWCESLLQSDAFRRFSSSLPVRIYLGAKELLESIVGYNLHQGIMAMARVPTGGSPEEYIPANSPHLVVALDGLVSAENVGVVIRNCAAFGVDAILVGETSSSPYLRRAVRNSMGTVFDCSIIHVDNLVESLVSIRKRTDTRIIGAHPHTGVTIGDATLSGKTCLVFGREGDGLSPAIREICDECVAIPMMNGTDSLNVGSASAVFLYESRKQRERKGE